MSEDRLDVIVVGAGLAGLAAAAELGRRGWRTAVLEAQDRAGGRTRSAPLPGQAQPLDWGAEWVIPELHGRICALAQQHGFALLPEGEGVSWDVPGFAASATYEEMRRLRPGFDAGLAALQRWADAPAQRDETRLSLAGLLRDLVAEPVDRHLIEAAIFPLTGADPEDLAAHALREEIRYHLQDIHLTLAPPTCRLDRGFGTLAVELAARLPAGVLRLNRPVASIALRDGGAHVEGPWGALWARRVLLAVPVACLHEIRFAPALPHVGRERSALMNAGQVVKFWARVEGRVPAARLQVGASPLRLLYSWKRDGQTFVSAQALAGDVARAMAEAGSPDPAGKAPALAELFTQACPGARVLEVQAHDWRADPHARGSWMAAAVGSEGLESLAQPHGALRIIGGDVAPQWIGWMEGALASAQAAVEELSR